MKPAKYHPLAENELIGSAAFYERRRPFLGDDFLDLVEETVEKIRRNPEMGRRGKFRTRSAKVRNFLSGSFTCFSLKGSGSLPLHI
jgi:plasmid stabilization system protein ParE